MAAVWNRKDLEEKCSKESHKLNEKREKIFFHYKCVQTLNKIHPSQESHPEKNTKNIKLTASIDGVPISGHTFLHIIQLKKAKKMLLTKTHMHLRLRVRAMRHLFESSFKSTDLKN